jgi:hypothetical protein
MSYKIPPSLNWLIDKRARIAGEIIRINKKLIHVQALIDRLKELESNLGSIDKSLMLHEIQIDINNIKPIRPHRNYNSHSKFPRGYQQKIILRYLISEFNNSPIPKTQIVYFFIKKHLEYDPVPLSYNVASTITSQVLARLYRKGKVTKFHSPKTTKAGSWSLASDYFD